MFLDDPEHTSGKGLLHVHFSDVLPSVATSTEEANELSQLWNILEWVEILDQVHTSTSTYTDACGTCPFALEWLPKVGDFVANKFAFSPLCVSEMASNDI